MSVLKYKDPVTGGYKPVGSVGGGVGTVTGDHYVTAFGAVGDGVTDDTEAFRSALAEKRVVFVPGGTYKLTGGIVIGDNCELELSQDTVLVFENTTGNCITLGMSSSLKGNHATVKVPYAFSGNVIYASTTTSDDVLAVPPFTKWDPQWKSGRYVTDINICKADYRGFHYSVNGECSGTAVYLSAEGNKNTETSLTFMWGVNYSGLRIAGAFKYGIHAENFNEGWNHEMRLEAFIDACEIGVFLKDCNNAYISAAVQPRRAYSESGVYKPYAKHGIVLTRSRNVDLSGSRVWDWNEKNTLWEIGNEYQHIAMYGDCRGLILNDYLYYEVSYDIRDLIYTDTPSNLEKMTILQEPIDRWFKLKDGMPYCSDGVVEKRIATEEELGEYFDTDLVKGYTDVLSTSITGKDDPSVFKGKGYGRGYVDSSGGFHDNDAYLSCTGYIPVKYGQTIYAEGLNFKTVNDECRIIAFDADFKKVWHVNRGLLTAGNDYHAKYTKTENGFSVRIEGDAIDNVHYVRFNFVTTDISDTPLMAVDEEIKYTVEGFLADGVKVKAENVIGSGVGGGGSIDVTAKVGQTIVVKEVDENSKPTAWEAVDLPSGENLWRLLNTVETTEEVTNILIDTDSEGNSFECNEVLMVTEKLIVGSANNNYFQLNKNNAYQVGSYGYFGTATNNSGRVLKAKAMGNLNAFEIELSGSDKYSKKLVNPTSGWDSATNHTTKIWAVQLKATFLAGGKVFLYGR